MASGTLKDTAKVLNGFFVNATTGEGLPKEIEQALEAFLRKHQDIDDHDSQRLQEELHNIHNRYVAKEKGKLGIFLYLLQTLRPVIKGQGRLQDWWTLVVEPVIDGMGHTRTEIDNASGFLLAVLDYDSDEDKNGEKAKVSSHFAKTLLDSYLKRTRILDAEEANLTKEDNFVAQQLSDVLVAYGRKKPKDFMIAIDRLVVSKDDRMQALALLSVFVRHQPPHLYLVSQTPLVEHLLQCLLVDTSTTVISLALITLIMFLPHIPSSVRTHLPRLFLIYSRLLCWERYGPSSSTQEKRSPREEEEEDAEEDQAAPSIELPPEETWEKLESTFENAESTTPELFHYFTFLYGLYPLNFTSYIRKPRKYLKKINFPRADEFDLDQKIIRSRTEQFSRLHLLHPSFICTTVEDELTDNRWLKSDPADVVAECMSLCIGVSSVQADLYPPPTAELPEIPSAYLKTEDIPDQSLLNDDDDPPLLGYDGLSFANDKLKADWRDTQTTYVSSPLTLESIEPLNIWHKTAFHGLGTSGTQSPAMTSPATLPRDANGDSPTLGATTPQISRQTSRSQRKGSVASTHTISETSLRVGTLSAPTRSQLPHSPALRAASKTEANMAFLQREVVLLKNDLNLERYLKQQHQMHIGQMQRRHIKEATVEAETQNLVNSNRTLKNKLAEANKAYTLLKKETTTNRNQSKKWETDLTSRLRTLREDERQWRDEEKTLRIELDKTRKECDHLRQLVVDSEAKELLAKQEVASVKIKLEQLEDLQTRLKELDDKVQGYEARELQYEEASDEKDIIATELATAKLRIQSRDADHEREKKNYDRRIQDLETRLTTAQNLTAGTSPGQVSPQVQQIIEQAVTAAKAKYTALKRDNVALQHRFLELEIRCKDLEHEAAEAAAATSQNPTFYKTRHQSSRISTGIPSSQWPTSASATDEDIHIRPLPSLPSSSTNTPIRPERPDRPVTSPSLPIHLLDSSPIASIGTSAASSSMRSGSGQPPPLPAPPSHVLNSNSPSSTPNSPPTGNGGRTLHRAGTLSPAGSQHRAASPMARSIAGDSVRSRADSDMGGPSGGGGGGGGGGAAGFYKSSMSAFSHDSLDSTGRDSQGGKSGKKIGAKSEVRVYGRGGAQNIGKGPKEKDEKKEREEEQRRREKRERTRTGGLLGIRGII